MIIWTARAGLGSLHVSRAELPQKLSTRLLNPGRSRRRMLIGWPMISASAKPRCVDCPCRTRWHSGCARPAWRERSSANTSASRALPLTAFTASPKRNSSRCKSARASVEEVIRMPVLGERAVVLGASMGGLLAARVLADFFDTVTVFERDELSDDPVNRRGVPQGRHVHALLPRGARVLDELFPGLVAELVAAGAPVCDDGGLSRGFS